MQQTILLPLDGMPLAETAIPQARLLAELLQGALELVRVVPRTAPGSAEAAARDYLERLARSPELSHVDSAICVMRGDPAECILQHAELVGATLVVMTTHARSGLRRAVLGSVAEDVLAQATTPVVLVRGATAHYARLQTLLVTLDSSCAAPMPMVMQLASAAMADVVLLRVVTAEEIAIWQWTPGEVLDEPQTSAIARLQLDDLAKYFEQNGIATRVRVQIGEIVPTILEVAEEVNADLIVTATHARTGAQRAIVGSISDAVVHRARTPVLVARQIPMTRRRTRRKRGR